jgi:hypothetical protein
MTSDPVVMPLALELLECLYQEISKVLTPPAHVQLRPGTVVDHLLSTSGDECCEGLAWVRPDSFYPSSRVFPEQDETPVPKGTSAWAVVLEMGAVRCAPTPDANSVPSGTEWSEVVQAVMDDAAAMRRAVCCFINAAPLRLQKVLVGVWQPISVQGGCVGGVLHVTVQGPACDCSQAGPTSS